MGLASSFFELAWQTSNSFLGAAGPLWAMKVRQSPKEVDMMDKQRTGVGASEGEISVDHGEPSKAFGLASSCSTANSLEVPMREPSKDAPADTVQHLNRVLKLDGPMSFQRVVLDNALSRHSLAFVAKRAGVRRETIWRYKTGVRAPFETLVKIVGTLGASLVVAED